MPTVGLGILAFRYRVNEEGQNRSYIYNSDSLADEKNSEDEILVYPNPSNNSITILTEVDAENIEIYDCLGKCVLNKQFINKELIHVSSLTSGIYLIVLTDSFGQVHYAKFVKE